MKAEKGKIIAVWGSPASGKSTFAVKLATAIYDNFEFYGHRPVYRP